MRRIHVSRVDAMLLATVMLWGLNFTATKYVLDRGFRPLAYSSTRYAAAALLCAAIVWRRERSLWMRPRDFALLGLPAVGALLANQFAFVYSIDLTTASTVALILGTTPIFVAILAQAIGFERLSRRFWIAAAVSFAGVGLVAVGEGGGLSADVAGDLIAVAVAVSWAGYSVVIAPLMRRYSPYRISAVILLATSVLLLASASPQLAKQDFGSLGWLTWTSFAYAVVGPLVLTNILYFTAIDRVGPARASLFTNLQPFAGALFAVALLSETMGPLQLGGAAAIATGIVLERRAHVRLAQPQPVE